MLVVGGQLDTVDLEGGDDSDRIPDPWPQGLGIFDMTNLTWRDEYDPDLPTYKTPDAIKKIYAQQGRYPQKNWSDPAAQKLFTTPDSTSNAAVPSSRNEPQSPSVRNKGVIAGGTVGGVVGVALLIALLSFLILRFRRREQRSLHSNQSQQQNTSETIQREVEGEEAVGAARRELGDHRIIRELNSGSDPRELLSDPPELMSVPPELMPSERRNELFVRGRRVTQRDRRSL